MEKNAFLWKCGQENASIAYFPSDPLGSLDTSLFANVFCINLNFPLILPFYQIKSSVWFKYNLLINVIIGTKMEAKAMEYVVDKSTTQINVGNFPTMIGVG
jgi:hypothetical protein